ncbi:MAG: hypothetical protein LBC74_11985 [Planctomycetaceae bacterium]|nr:hypothetical protein [Planctomycetaceae bacterium]
MTRHSLFGNKQKSYCDVPLPDQNEYEYSSTIIVPYVYDRPSHIPCFKYSIETETNFSFFSFNFVRLSYDDLCDSANVVKAGVLGNLS